MFTVIIHCTTAADIVITSVTFIQSQLLDVGRHPKDDSWSRGAKKQEEQHGQPSHNGRYADHAVQISPATNLGLFKIITIDYTNISQNWFSGFQESGFQAIRFNSKYPSIGTSKRSMNSQNFAHI